jgi:hypothetical protein
MKRETMIVAAAVLSLVTGAAAVAPAFAQEEGGVKIGVLECQTHGGWGYILGASRKVDCTYQPTADRVERYTGSMTKIGLDLGYKGPGGMAWAVFAPTTSMAPGALAGRYAGATASAAAGVGVGAHAMIGGSEKQVALQPLSFEGETGLNVAAGLGALQLTYVSGD